MTEQERAAVLRWLAHIGETDTVPVLTRCELDQGARAYYVGRAASVSTPTLDRLAQSAKHIGAAG